MSALILKSISATSIILCKELFTISKKSMDSCILVNSGLDSHSIQYSQKVHTHCADIRYI